VLNGTKLVSPNRANDSFFDNTASADVDQRK
jgi:hypothetical protein